MKSIYLLEHTVATKEVLGRIIWQGETFPLGRGKGIFSQRKCDGLSHFFYSVQQSTTCQRLADAKLSKLLVEELTGAAELSLKDFWLNAYGGKQSLLARPFLFSLLWLCIFWSVKTEQTNNTHLKLLLILRTDVLVSMMPNLLGLTMQWVLITSASQNISGYCHQQNVITENGTSIRRTQRSTWSTERQWQIQDASRMGWGTRKVAGRAP